MSRKRKVDPCADWSRSTTDLAREFGVTDAAVSSARGKYAPETKHVWRRVPMAWTEGIDWEAMNNKEIADLVPKSIGAIAYMRKKYAPHTVKPKGRPCKVMLAG